MDKILHHVININIESRVAGVWPVWAQPSRGCFKAVQDFVQRPLCDYALWKEINCRRRRQERSWAAGKVETSKQYLVRLKRTAMRLPRSFVEKSIGNMRRRCQLLFKAKGYHFEEGN